MSKRNRDSDWRHDDQLKTFLAAHYSQGLQQKELADFGAKHFPNYAWSERNLRRMLEHHGIRKHDKTVTVEQVKGAVAKELEGPGRDLGIRAMLKKVRVQHGLMVTRDQVGAVMFDLDREGLERRGNVGQKKHVRNKQFVSMVSVWLPRYHIYVITVIQGLRKTLTSSFRSYNFSQFCSVTTYLLGVTSRRAAIFKGISR